MTHGEFWCKLYDSSFAKWLVVRSPGTAYHFQIVPLMHVHYCMCECHTQMYNTAYTCTIILPGTPEMATRMLLEPQLGEGADWEGVG